ncbi:hypothetical protein Ndes2526B_g08494 [Nannochloris sp. 'desiccata']
MTVSLKELVWERLKKQGKLRKITLEDLALHSTPEKAWISVQGAVYDITEHVKRHAGWKCGCAVSELMAILRCLGTECTEEFLEIHSQHAIQRMQPYMIGELVPKEEAEKDAENKILNMFPSLSPEATPVSEKEHHDLNLCKR